MILSKYIFTDVVQSAARFYRTPADLSRHGTDGTTPSDGKTNIGSARLDSPFQIGVSTTVSPSRTGSQDIISPRGSIGPQWSRYAQPLDTFINGIYSEHRDPAPTWSKVIGCKFTDDSSADVNSRYRMNLTCDAVLTASPNFVNLGISSVHTSDELGSVFVPNTTIGTLTDGSNWLLPGHLIGSVTEYRVISMGSEQDFNAKTDF